MHGCIHWPFECCQRTYDVRQGVRSEVGLTFCFCSPSIVERTKWIPHDGYECIDACVRECFRRCFIRLHSMHASTKVVTSIDCDSRCHKPSKVTPNAAVSCVVCTIFNGRLLQNAIEQKRSSVPSTLYTNTVWFLPIMMIFL